MIDVELKIASLQSLITKLFNSRWVPTFAVIDECFDRINEVRNFN